MGFPIFLACRSVAKELVHGWHAVNYHRPYGPRLCEGFSQLLNQKKRPLCAMFCASGLTNMEPQEKKLCKIISSKVKHLMNTPKTPLLGVFHGISSLSPTSIHQAAPGESPPAARARWAPSAMRCGRPGWPQSRRAWHEPSLPHQQRRGRQLPRPHHGHNLEWNGWTKTFLGAWIMSYSGGRTRIFWHK